MQHVQLHKQVAKDNFSSSDVVGWVVPVHNAGMDYQQANFLCKCKVAPHLVDLHNLTLKNNLNIPHMG
jgi:hypothetical protein